jgi:hypothetical protein
MTKREPEKIDIEIDIDKWNQMVDEAEEAWRAIGKPMYDEMFGEMDLRHEDYRHIPPEDDFWKPSEDDDD